MSKYATYTDEFKSTMVQKVHTNSGKSVRLISKEAGIPSSTLKNWIIRYHQKKGLPVAKRKTLKWKPEDKLNAVILTASINEAERSEYCRKQGIYIEDLDHWKLECLSGFGDKSVKIVKKQNKNRERKLEQETKWLKKELRRKEKALAETAALLVLKKKAREIWGDPEEES